MYFMEHRTQPALLTYGYVIAVNGYKTGANNKFKSDKLFKATRDSIDYETQRMKNILYMNMYGLNPHIENNIQGLTYVSFKMNS